MAADGMNEEYDPEPFNKRKTFHVAADCQLNNDAKPLRAKMFVESLEPMLKRQQYPIIMVHGDYHAGQIWLTKPDGEPGWAAYFLRIGFQVYLVDLPPVGRSNFIDDQEFPDKRLKLPSISTGLIEKQLTAPEKAVVVGDDESLGWPSAILHNKWPGTGERGDFIFENYRKSTCALPLRPEERQLLAQAALKNLLKITGKAILLGQGSGATMAWLAADAVPDLVAGVIALEPAGPPFGTAHKMVDGRRKYTHNVQTSVIKRIYGLADIPLTYDPPARPVRIQNSQVEVAPLDLDVCTELRGGGTCILQRRGTENMDTVPMTKARETTRPFKPRQLINLKKMPHAVVTAPASSHSIFDWATVMFMVQAGLGVEWIPLEKHSIFGNGHLMFLESNSDESAQVLSLWIQRTVEGCQSPASKFTLTNEEMNFDGSSFQPIDLTSEVESRPTNQNVDDRVPANNNGQTTSTAPPLATPHSHPAGNAFTPQRTQGPGRLHNTRYDLQATPTHPQRVFQGHQVARLTTNNQGRARTRYPNTPWRQHRERSQGPRSNSRPQPPRGHNPILPQAGGIMPAAPFNPYPSPPYSHGISNNYAGPQPPSLPTQIPPSATLAYSWAMYNSTKNTTARDGSFSMSTAIPGASFNRNATQNYQQTESQNQDPFLASYRNG